MTLDEAKVIARIVDTADGYCTFCANDLRDQLTHAFPQFDFGKEGEDVKEKME